MGYTCHLFVVLWVHTNKRGVKMAKDKRLDGLLDELEAQGWELKPSKKGLMAYPPDKTKPPVSIHKTPSDVRAWANQLAQLRRSGFIQKAK